MSSVRNRLAALFFLITAAAIGFVYLYVVPQLRSGLTAEKLQWLERAGTDQREFLSAGVRSAEERDDLVRLVRRVAGRTDARVTLLAVPSGPAGGTPKLAVSESGVTRAAAVPGLPAAAQAADSGRVGSDVRSAGGQRRGEVAIPVADGPTAEWVAVLSSPLDDVDDAVALVRKQILIAGAIALAVALAAGWLVARAHAKRLGRLEAAAEQVAEGDFSTPIPDEGTDEVGQLAATLNEMQGRLARLDQARKEFIANASHELRTPIFSLGGFVELLDEDEPDPAARKEFVQTMREQVTRLTKLTADLLDLSKLDADVLQVNAESVDLGELAGRIAEEFGPAAERHGSPIDVDGGGAAVAVADPDRVAQIMRILVDNALTHTPQGTAISIVAQRRDGAARLLVRDDGPGIDPHVHARVFDRFYTGDRVSGSGLGLAIARELALLMDGELALASAPGRTEFTLRLPIGTARETAT
jgi:signal transduction histidine kinase